MRHALLALAALSLATTADAGVIYVKKGATGANNGTSWADAYTELQTPLPYSITPVVHAGDEIWVAQGTYTPATAGAMFSVPAGVRVLGGFAGNETSASQRDWNAHTTVLSGDLAGDDVAGVPVGINANGLVQLDVGGARLDGFLLTAVNISPPTYFGAVVAVPGVAISPALSIIANCRFERNVATCISSGGQGPNPFQVEVHGCVFIDNKSVYGALNAADGLATSIVVHNSTFARNIAMNIAGIGTRPSISSGNNHFYNCIAWFNDLPLVNPNISGSPDYVEYSNFQQALPWVGNISANPRFVNLASNDVRLRFSSPCIDSGSGWWIPLGLVEDIDGSPRVVDFPGTPNTGASSPVDMGAYEFHEEDCDADGVPDWSATAQSLVRDLNENWLPDTCEPLGTSFCFGDGTGTACPCGNVGPPSTGCMNSTAGGGRLRAIGTPSVTDDTVVFLCDGLGPTATGLYFQGTAFDVFAGPNGLVFGDGIRCVFGTIVRLPTRNSVNGQSAVGPGVPGDPPISVMGAPVMPGTRYYQVWYRDSAPFCTPAFYNMTNAVQITWGP